MYSEQHAQRARSARQERPRSAAAAIRALGVPPCARARTARDGRRSEMAARREIEAEIAELLQRPAVRLEDEALIAAAVRKRVDPTVGIKKKVARLQATPLREANRTCENVSRVAVPPSSTAWARPTPAA